jgi:hypothetical protein
MPIPSALISDPTGDYSRIYVSQLLVDVPLTGINAQVDIMTLGVIPAGNYLVESIMMINQVTAVAEVTLKLLQGAVVFGGSQTTLPVGNGQVAIGPVYLNLQAPAIVKVVGFSSVLTSLVKSVALTNLVGTQNFTSWLIAQRLS